MWVNCLSLVFMEIYKVCFTLVPITLNRDEFAKAYTKIEKVKPNIYY